MSFCGNISVGSYTSESLGHDITFASLLLKNQAKIQKYNRIGWETHTTIQVVTVKSEKINISWDVCGIWKETIWFDEVQGESGNATSLISEVLPTSDAATTGSITRPSSTMSQGGVVAFHVWFSLLAHLGCQWKPGWNYTLKVGYIPIYI